MKNNKSYILTSSTLLAIYCAIYPIMPAYFVLPGIGAVTNVFALIILIMVLICNHKIVINAHGFTERTFLIFIICTVLVSIYHAALNTALWFCITVLLAWFVFTTFINTRAKFLKLIDAIIGVGGILGVLAFFETITGFNPFAFLNNAGANLIDVQRLGVFRARSYTYQAITLGNYFMLVSGLCVYRIVNCSDYAEKTRFKAIYISLWIGVFSTMSRSSILFFILSQLLFGICLGFTKLIGRILLCFFAVGVFGFIYFGVFGKDSSFIFSVGYMILSVFDESYATELAGVANAPGNRLDLYQWVWDAIQGHVLLGMGPGATFSHDITYGDSYYATVITKTSIEVEYLKCLFHYGLLCLISKVLFMLTVLKTTLQNGYHYRKLGNKLSFELAMGIVFFTYFLSFFTVMQDTESRIFYIMIFLLLVNRKYEFDKNDILEDIGQ